MYRILKFFQYSIRKKINLICFLSTSFLIDFKSYQFQQKIMYISLQTLFGLHYLCHYIFFFILFAYISNYASVVIKVNIRKHQRKEMMQDQNESQRPILIYYKIRGNAQIIRSVLLEIGVEFTQIFVSNNGYLDPQIAKKYQLSLQNIPYLIHDGNVLHQVFPIIKYLCIFYNRRDLLGKTVYDKIKITQILVKYSKQRNIIMSTFFQGIKQIQQKNLGQNAIFKLADVLTTIVQRNKYCQATEKMFIKTGNYLCGYLTILDFIFYEKCFYFVNMLTVNNQPKGQLTRQYVRFYEGTQFYQKNKEFLQKYKLFINEVNAEMNILIQKMWIGDRKYLLSL